MEHVLRDRKKKRTWYHTNVKYTYVEYRRLSAIKHKDAGSLRHQEEEPELIFTQTAVGDPVLNDGRRHGQSDIATIAQQQSAKSS